MFNLETYDLVSDRITKFYEIYPDGVIITEPITDLNKIREYVVMRAKIWKKRDSYVKGEPPDAEGHSLEEAGGQGASKDAHVENSETSCIGRAMAALDIWIKRQGATAQEMKKVKIEQNHSYSIATEKQIKMIYAKFSDAKINTVKEMNVYLNKWINSDLDNIPYEKVDFIVNKLKTLTPKFGPTDDQIPF